MAHYQLLFFDPRFNAVIFQNSLPPGSDL